MKLLLIMNPGSNGNRSQKHFQRIFKILSELSIDYEARITDSLEDAYQYSLSANREGYELIVAVGGDGTINRVINGFYHEDGSRNSRAQFAVIYTGTSPDFCKSYKIPYRNIAASIETIRQGFCEEIPVGRIRFQSRLPEDMQGIAPTTRFFACCANIGLGGNLASYANSGIRRFIGDGLGTFISLIRTLLNYQPADLSLRRDGVEIVLSRLYSLSVGITPYIASGIKVFFNQEECQHRFYNMIVQNLRLRDMPRIFYQIYSGKSFANDNTMRLEYGKRLEIQSNPTIPYIEFDGDLQGYLPCEIELARDSLSLIRGK